MPTPFVVFAAGSGLALPSPPLSPPSKSVAIVVVVEEGDGDGVAAVVKLGLNWTRNCRKWGIKNGRRKQ